MLQPISFTDSHAHIDVAILEPTPMACELLSHAIESSCSEIKVITTGVSSEFQNDAEMKTADVAVIGLALKDDPNGGLKLMRRLVRERPNINCVLLLDEDNRDITIEAFRSVPRETISWSLVVSRSRLIESVTRGKTARSASRCI